MAYRLFTSFFKNGKGIIEAKAVAVRISVGAPRWSLPYPIEAAIEELMPTRQMLQLARPDYLPLYLARLERAGVDTLMRRFNEIARRTGREDLALLCFEDPGRPQDWCHRHMFRDWWMEKTGEVIEELGTGSCCAKKPAAAMPPPKPKKSATDHPSLFEGLV